MLASMTTGKSRDKGKNLTQVLIYKDRNHFKNVKIVHVNMIYVLLFILMALINA
ncbi:protein of unknown function [Ruminococcaceae bacterium BL-4]|nr:protein of unknown function [Ruminococcaceae bacterium BL-4]